MTPRNTLVEVTQEDLDQKNYCQPAGCPLALALQRTFKYARVGVKEARIIRGWGDEGHEFYGLSEEVNNFVRDYDSRRPVEPITIEVDPIWHVISKRRES